MNNFILWNCSHELYEDSGIQNLIILSKCNGIVIDADSRSQEFYYVWTRNMDGSHLRNSILLLNEWYDIMMKQFPEIKTFYVDELFTNPQQHGNPSKELSFLVNHQEYNFYQDYKVIIGEPDIDKFPKLTENEEITFSAYHEYIKFYYWFGKYVRIKKSWTNQISLCKKLEEKYGDNWWRTTHEGISLSKFNLCWISLNSNRNDYAELINWCQSHNKQIALFVDDETSEKTFKDRFFKFDKLI